MVLVSVVHWVAGGRPSAGGRSVGMVIRAVGGREERGLVGEPLLLLLAAGMMRVSWCSHGERSW